MVFGVLFVCLFFWHFYHVMNVLLEHLDNMIHTYFVFVLQLCSRNSFGFLTTKRHLYDNLSMHTAIFKLFPSAVNPVGRSTAQSFSTWISTLTLWILIKFIKMSVPDFTFCYAIYLCQISWQSGCILKVTFLHLGEKNSPSTPLTPWRRKKIKKKWEILATNIPLQTQQNLLCGVF